MPTVNEDDDVTLTPEEIDQLKKALSRVPNLRKALLKAQQAGLDVSEELDRLADMEAKTRRLLTTFR